MKKQELIKLIEETVKSVLSEAPKLTGKETVGTLDGKYLNKQFLQYFQNHYGYITPNISSKELERYLAQPVIKKVTIAKAADYFQDYLLANGLADVQEGKNNGI